MKENGIGLYRCHGFSKHGVIYMIHHLIPQSAHFFNAPYMWNKSMSYNKIPYIRTRKSNYPNIKSELKGWDDATLDFYLHLDVSEYVAFIDLERKEEARYSTILNWAHAKAMLSIHPIETPEYMESRWSQLLLDEKQMIGHQKINVISVAYTEESLSRTSKTWPGV